MISDCEIDQFLKLAEHCFEKTLIFRGTARKKYFLERLHIDLHNTQHGTIAGACHRCLGTGYEPDRKGDR